MRDQLQERTATAARDCLSAQVAIAVADLKAAGDVITSCALNAQASAGLLQGRARAA